MTIKPLPVLEGETATDRLFSFYTSLGWDREKRLNPSKVSIHEDDWTELLRQEMDLFPEDDTHVGFLWVNYGPSGRLNVSRGCVKIKVGSGIVAREVAPI